MADGETLETLRSCRDHWKRSFEHERENVIRLRGMVAECHESHFANQLECICADCQLVREHAKPQ